MSYEAFLAKKLAAPEPDGFEPPHSFPWLFPFQADIVRWAIRRGRSAVFASTGLGKTRMQLAWAQHVHEFTKGNVLILAPLAVAAQTQLEGAGVGLAVNRAHDQTDVRPGINITNYERIHKFDASTFSGVVLDESSCIKHFASKTLKELLEAFGATPFRLCATATPAPNDFTELGTHAEFLGVSSRQEMLAEFFCHDGGETQVWRLKGHARKQFWKWVASWGALVRSPEDLGHDGSGYDLPPLKVKQHTLKVENEEVFATGELFPSDSATLMERKGHRKASLDARVKACAALVNKSKEPWVVWCDLNAESEALIAAIPDAIEVTGSMTLEEKENALRAFADGEARVLVSKPSICGFGLNWQHCARMSFVGITDSWESYFQAIRRCWRFGQKRPVEVHVYASEMEGAVVRNLERKAADAEKMAEELSRETAAMVRDEVLTARSRLRNNTNHETKIMLPSWLHTKES